MRPRPGRDGVAAAVMDDRRLKAMADPKAMPFGGTRRLGRIHDAGAVLDAPPGVAGSR